MNNKVTIIMYHYVRDLKHSRYPEIKGLDSGLFKGQLEFLAKHYSFITMEQVIDCISKDETLPENPVLLTFDDAYIDHFNVVYPILYNMGVQGSFFTPVKAVMEHTMLDVNKIHFILASEKDKKKLIEKIYNLLDKYREQFSLETNSFYYQKLAKDERYDSKEVIFIKRLLQVELKEELRNLLCDELFKEFVGYDQSAFSRELYMNSDQIKCMLKNGMHMGAHGYNHYWLGSLNKKKQEEEISKSFDFIKSIGADLNYATMCYPYGNYNQDTLELLKKYKFKIGLTTEVAIANLKTNNPFELPRLDTNNLPKEATAGVNEWYIQ